jgi:transcriptional regulator of acetoin/glycerol metabolism
MRDDWVGLEVGVDARDWARLLRRAHEASVVGGHAPSIVRRVVAASWERCAETGMDPGTAGAPLLIDAGDAHERWREHPLSRATELLRGALGGLLHDARHILVVSDADGTLLWSEGHPDLMRASERIAFTPGHAWSEGAAGTNAVGTALAADHAVQIFSAEHFRAAVHGWQCSAAPVHDPDSGRTLGVIDVTGDYRSAHPHNLALVQTAARLIEEQLRREMLERDAKVLQLFAERAAVHGGPLAALSASGRVLAAVPATWSSGRVEVPADGGDVALPDGSAAAAQPLGDGLLLEPKRAARRRRRADTARIVLVGRDRAALATRDGSRRLTARHSELVALLALHPDGLDSSALATLVYGAPGHEVSLRAELHRLRAVLGPHFATRPYRLRDVEVDPAAMRELLRAGRRGRRTGRPPA